MTIFMIAITGWIAQPLISLPIRVDPGVKTLPTSSTNVKMRVRFLRKQKAPFRVSSADPCGLLTLRLLMPIALNLF